MTGDWPWCAACGLQHRPGHLYGHAFEPEPLTGAPTHEQWPDDALKAFRELGRRLFPEQPKPVIPTMNVGEPAFKWPDYSMPVVGLSHYMPTFTATRGPIIYYTHHLPFSGIDWNAFLFPHLTPALNRLRRHPALVRARRKRDAYVTWWSRRPFLRRPEPETDPYDDDDGMWDEG